jgi:hypothetical protein
MNRGHKVITVLFFLAVCAVVPAVNRVLNLRRAEEATPSDLYKVIHSQLDAFRAEDFPLAYSQASFGMRQKFSQEQFEKLIRRDYADIARADRIEFGDVKIRDNRALIQVFFFGRDGSVQPCIYNLIYEEQRWKINGVDMLPRWPAGSQFEGIRA